MRKYLNLLVVAMFSAGLLLAVGCGGTETKKEPEKTEKTESSASNESTENTTASNEDGNTVAAGDMQDVSLNLPNMTWGGCASSVRRALGDIAEISDINTDTSSRTCTFKVKGDLDVKGTLNKLAESNEHIKDWKMSE